jgi:fructosamine-3-kinase
MIDLEATIAEVLGAPPRRVRPEFTSDWAHVVRVEMADGSVLAAKYPKAGAASTTQLEGRMLKYLGAETELPVPQVMAVTPDILLMSFIEARGGLNEAAQKDAAMHIAKLHDLSSEDFGFPFDTLYGPADQPNSRTPSWVEFFRDRRLLHMARVVTEAGRISNQMMARIEALADKLNDLISEPEMPSLLHGDLWQGNVIINNGRVAAFLDPAIYFGHAEMDLAFSTLFGTMKTPFFDVYSSFRTIEADFFEVRKDIYNLWPLLGHVLFFGESYLGQVEAVLHRHGV